MKTFLEGYNHENGVYNDIIDGAIYQKQSAHVNEDGSFPISLYCHIDGAPALKSKSVSLWPIPSFITELPLSLKYSYKNILMSGLWFGKAKPDMNVFQAKFVEEVKSLQNGFHVDVVGSPGQKFKLMVIGQVADLMAKAPSIKFKLHNGKFGCSVCLHPGTRVPGKGNKRIYLFSSNGFARRNHVDSIAHAHLADVSGEAVFGIKGVLPVHEILQIPDMLPFDYMHQVLEGEYTRRLSKWLTGACPSQISLACSKANITKGLLRVVLPHDFKRKFRSLNEFHKWKATEKLALSLHAGLPLLKQMLPPEYYFHHALLVTGVRMLCEDKITDIQVSVAEAMLASYTRLLPNLFGECEATFTSHALTHLAEQVRGHEPLIVHYAFVFEAMLAHLKRHFHGTRGIADQICRKLAISQHAHQHVRGNLGNNQAAEFVERVLRTQTSNVVQLRDDIKFFAPLQHQIPHIPFPIEGFPANITDLRLVQRMLRNNEVYHSLSYACRRNSASFLLQFEDAGIGAQNF